MNWPSTVGENLIYLRCGSNFVDKIPLECQIQLDFFLLLNHHFLGAENTFTRQRLPRPSLRGFFVPEIHPVISAGHPFGVYGSGCGLIQDPSGEYARCLTAVFDTRSLFAFCRLQRKKPSHVPIPSRPSRRGPWSKRLDSVLVFGQAELP